MVKLESLKVNLSALRYCGFFLHTCVWHHIVGKFLIGQFGEFGIDGQINSPIELNARVPMVVRIEIITSPVPKEGHFNKFSARQSYLLFGNFGNEHPGHPYLVRPDQINLLLLEFFKTKWTNRPKKKRNEVGLARNHDN